MGALGRVSIFGQGILAWCAALMWAVLIIVVLVFMPVLPCNLRCCNRVRKLPEVFVEKEDQSENVSCILRCRKRAQNLPEESDILVFWLRKAFECYDFKVAIGVHVNIGSITICA